MIKADSRPVIIDEFESDQGRSHIAGVIRLARSVSSAESPVLRGTPEGKAMQFALRTTFFFAAVNPSGMSPADATRILLFEMLAHNNEPDEAGRIAEDEALFSDKGPDWCGYMAGLAHVIPPAIAAFAKALPGIDSRHRKNVATLLGGAFVALECRTPTDAEAEAIAKTYKGVNRAACGSLRARRFGGVSATPLRLPGREADAGLLACCRLGRPRGQVAGRSTFAGWR